MGLVSDKVWYQMGSVSDESEIREFGTVSDRCRIRWFQNLIGSGSDGFGIRKAQNQIGWNQVGSVPEGFKIFYRIGI
jgi:hypothetical protein